MIKQSAGSLTLSRQNITRSNILSFSEVHIHAHSSEGFNSQDELSYEIKKCPNPIYRIYGLGNIKSKPIFWSDTLRSGGLTCKVKKRCKTMAFLRRFDK